MKYCRQCEQNTPLKGRRLCLSCINVKEREKRKLKISLKKFREQKKKEKRKFKRENSYKKISKLAWSTFSKFIRQLYADFQGYVACYTCYTKIPWQELQAGHFNHRGRRRYQAIDFEIKHIKPQCSTCNMYGVGNGEQYEFGKHLERDYGEEWVKEIEKRRRTEPALTIEELKFLTDIFKNKLSTMATNRHLTIQK